MDTNLETISNYIEQFFSEAKNNENQQQMLFRIQYGNIQRFSPAIQNLLQQKLTKIKTFCITNCRLHTLQNFPLLPSLLYLDISNNMLIGSFQFIVKNRTIKYIDLSFNYISHIQKLQFLRVFKSIQIYAHNNPFCKDLSRKQQTELKKKLKRIHVDLVSLPRKLCQQSPVQKERKMLVNQKKREESKKNMQQKKQKDKLNKLKIQLQEIRLGLIERMTYLLLNREINRSQLSQFKQKFNVSDQQIKEAASRIIEKTKIRTSGKAQNFYKTNVKKNKDESEDENEDEDDEDSSSEEREQAKFSQEQENSISESQNESNKKEESEEVQGKKTQGKN